MVSCFEPILLPVDGATIPANATELVVLLNDFSLEGAELPALMGSDGSTIELDIEPPSSLGPNVARLRVLSPLVQGVEYRLAGLTAMSRCFSPSFPSVVLETAFVVGPPAALPSRAGTLTVGDQYVRAAESCGGGERSIAHLGYTEGPSVAPWRALAFAQIIVSGGTSPFGPAGPSPLDPYYGVTWALSADCETELATFRTASLEVTIPGVLNDSTNAVDFDMSCNTFEGCSVGDVRRSGDRPPTRGAALLVLGVGLVALLRRRKARRGAEQRLAIARTHR